MVERTSRLHTFTDVGPADLCNIHKHGATSKKAELGTFLYYTGVDTSNSASIAAHLQGLANLISARSQYWFGEKKHWKVPELTYCTYNAFSRVDMRVTVHIPGKFETSIVGADGKLLHDVPEADSDLLWLETFVCSVVRCMLDTNEDDANRVGGLVEIRRENPFNNGPVSHELLASFVVGFEQLFWQGPKLGCGVDIPQPTLVCNYLVDGFLRCIQLTQQYDTALDVLRRLEKKEPAVATLIARVLLLKDDEIHAVQVMADGIASNKRDANLLLVQTQFLLDKKRYDLALASARQAVQSAPSDFQAWAALVTVYTKLNDFENALLTLNLCPMNSHKEKFAFRRIVPLRGGADDLHLPSPVDVTLDEVSGLHSSAIAAEQKTVDQHLASLPAANLKSTFAKAYDLLTEIVVKTGWEALLKYRAKVFVMEEEYRKGGQDIEHDQDQDQAGQDTTAAEDNEIEAGGANGAKEASENSEGKDANNESQANGEPTDIAINDGSVNGSRIDDTSSTLAVKSPKAQRTGRVNHDELRKKRLCERWLDNLFMLLYEDLRAYTMWQAESVHFQAQQLEYKKTTLEWELLGQVAFRLKHFKEGSVAFTNALRGRFSARSQREVLRYYTMERTKILSKSASAVASNVAHTYAKTSNQLNEKVLECCIKLLVWNHRWYNDFSPELISTVSDLVAKEGLIKIQSLVQAVYSNNINHLEGMANHGITDMMDDLYAFFKAYGLSGTEN